MFESKGMKNYMDRLMHMRINHETVGFGNHGYDRQFKEWCRGRAAEEIMSPKERVKAQKKQAQEAKKQSKKKGGMQKKLSPDRVQKILERATKDTGVTIASAVVPLVGSTIVTASASSTPSAKEQELRKKLLREQMQQMANGWKCEEGLKFFDKKKRRK